MKFGLRTPSLKKSFKARTTGRAKRAVKKALIIYSLIHHHSKPNFHHTQTP